MASPFLEVYYGHSGTVYCGDYRHMISHPICSTVLRYIPQDTVEAGSHWITHLGLDPLIFCLRSHRFQWILGSNLLTEAFALKFLSFLFNKLQTVIVWK